MKEIQLLEQLTGKKVTLENTTSVSPNFDSLATAARGSRFTVFRITPKLWYIGLNSVDRMGSHVLVNYYAKTGVSVDFQSRQFYCHPGVANNKVKYKSLLDNLTSNNFTETHELEELPSFRKVVKKLGLELP